MKKEITINYLNQILAKHFKVKDVSLIRAYISSAGEHRRDQIKVYDLEGPGVLTLIFEGEPKESFLRRVFKCLK